MKKHAAHHARNAKKGGKHEKSEHPAKRKVMGSGKDGRSGSTKIERRLEKEEL
jgi:hypothetical protein